MNGLTIFVILLLLVFALVGSRAGCIRNLLTIGTGILSIYASSILYWRVSKWIQLHTSLVDSMADGISRFLLTKTAKEVENVPDQIEMISKIHVPEMMKQALISNNNPEIYEQLGVADFYHYVGHFAGSCIVNAITYVAIAAIIFIASLCLLYWLNIMLDFPIVEAVDQIVGGMLGMLQGVVVTWVILAIITVAGNMNIKAFVLLADQLSGSLPLLLLNKVNPILHFVFDIGKVLF